MSEDQQTEVSGRPSDRRLLAVGLVAALLLGGGGLVLLAGGGEPVAAETVAVVPRAAVAATVPSASSTPSPSPSATRHHDHPQNPFQPRIVGAQDGEGAPGDVLTTQVPVSEPVPGAPLEDPVGELPVGEQPAGEQPAGEEPVGEQPVGQQPTLPPGPTSTGVPVPTVAPPGTATPPAPPATAVPTATAAQHTLVLTRVTGTPPDLHGRFLVDGEVVTVAPGTAFGPGDTLNLIGLEQTGDGWVAVLQVGTQQPRNHPLGVVLRFS